MNEKNMISSSICDASATVKFNFNEMDKTELLQMLAFMQGELEAREIVIATLKSEKCKQLLYQAKYGRLNTALVSPKTTPTDLSNDNWVGSNADSIFSIYDPFMAMQRDIEHVILGADHSIDGTVESNLKPVYDSQLNQLENLISSQKKAQMKMKEQIMYLEKKCVKLTQALEDERNKHERDAAQGDDVLVMLEKERERLKSELDYERSHCRKLERELKRMVAVIEDQKSVIQTQRLAASVIIKTKNQMESDFKAVNMIINKTVNVTDGVGSDTSTKHNSELTEIPPNSPTSGQFFVQRNNTDRCYNSTDQYRDNPIPKSMKNNTCDIQSLVKHTNKYPQSKEPVPKVSVTMSEPIVTMSHQVTIPIQKSRTGKQPESLLWKTYDPKNNLPNSGHSPVSLSSKSPSNNRRQLPNVSMSNAIPISSLSRQPDPNYYKHQPNVVTSSSCSSASATVITPYQKILSTPPPNSIMNQAAAAASFQSSLTSYGIFNMCSPSISQSLGSNAGVYKSAISSTKSVDPNHSPTIVSSTALPRPRVIASPIVSTSTTGNSAMIRSGESSPAIPKHVYVNGK